MALLEKNPALASLNRYRWIDRILSKVENKGNLKAKEWSRKLDRILCHRFFGLIIFIWIMYSIFQAIYTWADPFIEGIESFLHIGGFGSILFFPIALCLALF